MRCPGIARQYHDQVSLLPGSGPEEIMEKRASMPDRDHAEINELSVDFVR